MDIKQIQQAKKELEQNLSSSITRAIGEFSAKTEVSVSGVSINTYDVTSVKVARYKEGIHEVIITIDI